ncbi:MAG: hypothetical protein ACPH86_06305, partial [Schleiferiaceae bacterium]
HIEFSHMGHRGRSRHLRYENLLNSTSVGVNLPVRATEEGLLEPIKCNIKQRRRFLRFLPDKTISSAFINLLQHQSGDTVEGVVRDHRGKDTGARLKLFLWDTQWVKGPYDFEPRNYRKAAIFKMDWYYQMATRNLATMVDRYDFGDTEVLRKPTELADPDLPTVKLLDDLIVFPKEDEFVPLDKIMFKRILPFMNRFMLMTNRNNPISYR